MKQAIFLLLCSCFIFSCTESNAPHFPPDKMQAILEDLHIAESYSVIVKQDSLRRGSERDYDSLAVYYTAVFKHHNVSYKEFEENLTWYKQHPEELDSVYIRTIDSMVFLQNSFQLIKP